MKANIQPLSNSLQPSPPSAGAIEVNRMNVPCIMLNPIRKRKLVETKVDTIGNLNTLTMFVIMPPMPLSTEPSEDFLASGGRLSGRRVMAKKSENSDRALENTHGSRYG